MEHRRFTSIEQFKNIVKHVRDYAKKDSKPLPTLKFNGTVKIHGTNASVLFSPEQWWAQSRERVLSIESDNAGFCMFAERNLETFRAIEHNVRRLLDDISGTVAIYGEWAGKGIQKAVGVNQIDKFFCVFNICVYQGEQKIHLTKDQMVAVIVRTPDIHLIHDFSSYEVEIDFNNPSAVQNFLYEKTMEVEKECPVAKQLGATPENGSMVGEGIVWLNEETHLIMKTKGSEHVAGAHKVSTVKDVSPAEIERMNSIQEFVENMVSDARLHQGIEKMKELNHPLENKSTGNFIKWVVADTVKEEKDVIVASGFDAKEIMPKISDKAKNFWFKYLEENT